MDLMNKIIAYLLLAIVAVGQTTYNNLTVKTNLTVSGVQVAAKVNTVADLVAMVPTQNGMLVQTLGRNSAGDGGGATFYWSASSTASTNLGTVFQKASGGTGRFIWSRVGNLTVEMFGADNTGTTDSSAAIQAAFDWAAANTKRVDFGSGTFIAQGLNANGIEIHGAGFSKLVYDTKTTIRAPIGSTASYIINLGPGNQIVTTLQGVTVVGYRENNIYNLRPITGVTSRTVFTVAATNSPTTTDEGAFPRFGFAFFYSPENRYIGYGMISAVNTNTGQVTLATGWDHYAAPSAGGNLTTDYKVSFSALVTNTLPAFAGGIPITYNDHAAPGIIGIQINGQNVILRDVYVWGCHMGINYFAGTAVSMDEVWVENCSFANIGSTMPNYGNADCEWGRVFVQGLYTTDQNLSAETTSLYDQSWRSTAFGVFNPPSFSTFNELTVARCVNGMAVRYLGSRTFVKAFFDVPVKRCVYNVRSTSLYPLDSWLTLAMRSFGNYSSLTNRLQPSNVGTYQGWYEAAGTANVDQIGNLEITAFGGAATNNFDRTFELFGANSVVSIGQVLRNNGSASWVNLSGGATYPIVAAPNSVLSAADDPYKVFANSTSINVRANGSTHTAYTSSGATVSGSTTFTGAPVFQKADASTLATFERSGVGTTTFDLGNSLFEISANTGINAVSIQGPSATQGRLDIRPRSKSSGTGGDSAYVTTLNWLNTQISLFALNTSSGSDVLQIGRGGGLPGPTSIEFLTTATAGTGTGVVRGGVLSNGKWYLGPSAVASSFSWRRTGTVALVGGTATVADANVTANTIISLTSQVDGGTPGWLRVSARSAGVSFTITSSSATDTSTVGYEMIEP